MKLLVILLACDTKTGKLLLHGVMFPSSLRVIYNWHC